MGFDGEKWAGYSRDDVVYRAELRERCEVTDPVIEAARVLRDRHYGVSTIGERVIALNALFDALEKLDGES